MKNNVKISVTNFDNKREMNIICDYSTALTLLKAGVGGGREKMYRTLIFPKLQQRF